MSHSLTYSVTHSLTQALLADQEKVKRQQQYLGAAAGLVEEKRNKELLLAKERQIRVEEAETAETERLAGEVKHRMSEVLTVTHLLTHSPNHLLIHSLTHSG